MKERKNEVEIFSGAKREKSDKLGADIIPKSELQDAALHNSSVPWIGISFSRMKPECWLVPALGPGLTSAQTGF